MKSKTKNIRTKILWYSNWMNSCGLGAHCGDTYQGIVHVRKDYVIQIAYDV